MDKSTNKIRMKDKIINYLLTFVSHSMANGIRLNRSLCAVVAGVVLPEAKRLYII